MALSGPTCRLSVRAFTQLFDEEKNGLSVGSPLFTDTYLSLPVVTEAGEDRVPDGQTQERERAGGGRGQTFTNEDEKS